MTELTDINDIHQLLRRHGFRFSKSMGQNFLIAAWVPERIADSALIDRDTAVLEIGPGIGCLTRELSLRAGKVASIELDTALKPILRETLMDCDNVEIIYGDALKTDLRAFAAEHFGAMKSVVCANIPYNVTSPLLTALIKAECFSAITVMIQKEVAKRICAPAGTADYGAFGIFVQWYMDAELLFDVPASCFVPQPKVTSSVIRLTRRKSPPAKVKNEALLFKIIRAAFNQRRKTLVNGISSGLNLSKERVAKALSSCGFDPKVRGEDLNISEFAKIADEIETLNDSDL